jgi:two-component system, cell cycle response regulator DivK
MPPRFAPPLPSVLVVDDFADGRELVAEYLVFRGFPVRVASDGAEAIDIARATQPRIILMDLSMTGVDGWHAARVLKADPLTAAITIIAVTAHAMKPEIDSAKAAGCDGVITKPFDLQTLADALPRLLKVGLKALDVPGLSLTAPTAYGTRQGSEIL